MKPIISEEAYQELLRSTFGEEWAAVCNLPYDERMRALARIQALQGESPADRAWPMERGNDPEPEEGWDSSGTYRPDVLRRVYQELVAAGVIKTP
jgi:hypothetical protein